MSGRKGKETARAWKIGEDQGRDPACGSGVDESRQRVARIHSIRNTKVSKQERIVNFKVMVSRIETSLLYASILAIAGEY